MITYIITGGSISDAQVQELLAADSEDKVIIAADKGMECCIRLEVRPNYLIGDFDSASTEALAKMKEWNIAVTKLNPIKDDTDTEAALHLAFEKTQGDIIILGGTGTRMDHVLGNIAILGQGFEVGRKIYLIDSNNRIQLIDREVTIAKDKQFGKYISVLPLTTEVRGLCEIGFYYPLDHYTMNSYTSLGISNEIVEDYGTITIEDGVLIVIESND